MIKIEERHTDLIKELVNIGMGQSANILNQMIGAHITLKVPHLKILEREKLLGEFENYSNEVLASVEVPFSKGIQGVAKLVFPSESASKLVNIFIGNLKDSIEVENMDAFRMSALSEIGNVIINTIVGTIGNYTEVGISFSVPEYDEGMVEEIIGSNQLNDTHMILLCVANFIAEQVKITGSLILFFKIDRFEDFITIIEKHYQKII